MLYALADLGCLVSPMPMAITLRPMTPDDMPFLYQVYASTRLEELAPVGWTPEQVGEFLTQQFTAQHQFYQEHYENATYNVIIADGQQVGRLYLARWPTEIRIMDIALLPAYRGLGIGSALLQAILEEGERTGKRVSIHVEKVNPALRLYERLGFRPSADRGVYWFMEWQPTVQPSDVTQ